MGRLISSIPSSSRGDVRLVISDHNWLESSAVDQLVKTADLPGMCCAVGMPDLHPGKGQPIGAAFVSRKMIYPHLVGSDIGCGMGVWKLAVKPRKINLERWDKKLTGLDDNWTGDYHQRLLDAGINDQGKYHDSLNEKLGTIGGGNHFAEFQAVNKVFDESALISAGLDADSVVLLVHSGSRGLGQSVLRQHVDHYGAQGLSEDTESAAAYLQAHNHALNWAKVNRDVIAQRFCQRLSLARSPILDVSHNTVLPLPACLAATMGLANDGGGYWIHRKGASPATDPLVMIPGSRGSLSYLVKPIRSDLTTLAQGGFSLAHGAGRKWKRSESKGRLEGRFKVIDLMRTRLGSRVICEHRDLLYEEAPQAYKNIDRVVDDLVQAQMIDLIASFKPIITYKTRKKR